MIKKLTGFYTKRLPREKKIILVTAAVCLVLFSDRFVAGPVIHNLGGYDRKIHDEETAIRTSLQVLLQKERILVESKEYEHYSTGSGNSELETTELLRDVQAMADQSSLSLLYVKPASQKEGDGMKKYFASLEAEGEMEAVATFFHRVESSDKLLKIEKFEIQPKKAESSLARATATVSKTVLD